MRRGRLWTGPYLSVRAIALCGKMASDLGGTDWRKRQESEAVMAGSVNKVILVGNLGADPEVRRLN